MKTLQKALSGLMILALFAPNLFVFAQEVPLVTVNVDENISTPNPIQKTEGNTVTPTVSEENVVVETLENTDEQNEKEVSLETKVSDSDFINALGASANSINKESYFTFGQRLKFGNANSNNFVHEVGSQVGIGDQVTEFSSFMTNKVYVPGGNRGLPTNSLRQMVRSGVDQAGKQISKLFKN